LLVIEHRALRMPVAMEFDDPGFAHDQSYDCRGYPAIGPAFGLRPLRIFRKRAVKAHPQAAKAARKLQYLRAKLHVGNESQLSR